MKVLLVEPFAHIAGHYSKLSKNIGIALAGEGVDVTFLTFDGIIGGPSELSRELRHITFVSRTGVLAPLIRFLPRLCPVKSIRITIELVWSTLGTFLEVTRHSSREKYDVVHILDTCMLDYAFHCFAAMVKGYNLVFSIMGPSRETALGVLRQRAREALTKKQFGTVLETCLGMLFGTGPATAFRRFLYHRASKRNNLAFICCTKAEQESYKYSPFYKDIVLIREGMVPSEGQTLTRIEARKHLNLSSDDELFLHFGVNHFFKNFEVIFQAAQGLAGNKKLLFAGMVKPEYQGNNPVKLAKKYNLEANTIVVDRYIPGSEARFYFSAADAIILSHRKGFTGISGVLLTAAEFALPVIASDIGETGEITKDYRLGLTFEPENPESLREAVLHFLSLKDEERQAMKKNLEDFTRVYSWSKQAKRYISLYQSILEGRPLPEQKA